MAVVALCCLWQVAAQQQQRPLGLPYFDPDSGQICEEGTATVEETEYDEQIHCKVQMKRRCRADRLDALLDNLAEAAAAAEGEEEEEDEMGEACHTMYKKECRISYRPRMTKAIAVKQSTQNECFMSRDQPKGPSRRQDGRAQLACHFCSFRCSPEAFLFLSW